MNKNLRCEQCGMRKRDVLRRTRRKPPANLCSKCHWIEMDKLLKGE